MTGNNAMSANELLDFIENKHVWDYYKFPAFYSDKYKSKNTILTKKFLNTRLDFIYRLYHNDILKYFDYKSRCILLNGELFHNIIQSFIDYKQLAYKWKPCVKDLINLCNFFLYLYEQNEEKFNIIIKFITNDTYAILLACMYNYRKDRIAQFLMNEFLNSNENKIFNISVTLHYEVGILRIEQPYNSIGYHVIFTVKKLNLFYNLIAVKDNSTQFSCKFPDYYYILLNNIEYLPDAYKVKLLKEKLKNNIEFRDKIIKIMTFYFKFVVGYNYYDVNPFEAFCYLGFKLCPTNNSLIKAVKSYLVKNFFIRNHEDISCFCYILLKYFDRIFANLVPDEARDVHSERFPFFGGLFDRIFEKCDYYTIFKFIAESPLKDEYPNEFYIEQFKSIDGMDEIFSNED